MLVVVMLSSSHHRCDVFCNYGSGYARISGSCTHARARIHFIETNSEREPAVLLPPKAFSSKVRNFHFIEIQQQQQWCRVVEKQLPPHFSGALAHLRTHALIHTHIHRINTQIHAHTYTHASTHTGVGHGRYQQHPSIC